MTTENATRDAATPPVPKLADAALTPFRALLWAGLLVLVVAVIAVGVGASKDGYDEELAQAAAYAFAGSAVLWSVILLAAAGIVAGLGKRQGE